MPIVVFDAMLQAFLRDAGVNYHDMVYWSQQADWKRYVTTPNASSWYVYIAFPLTTHGLEQAQFIVRARLEQCERDQEISSVV